MRKVLLCFPHAGGIAADYRGWRGELGSREVVAITFPGRERRFDEPLLDSVAAMADFAMRIHEPEVTSDCVLWGHSLGALVAFETALRMEQRGLRPTLLAVGGCRAPSIRGPEAPIHALPGPALTAELVRLGGMADEILAEPELVELLLPRLRADLRAAETYPTSTAAIDAPICALGGRDDDHVDRASLEAWGAHTKGAFHHDILPGDHFFVRSSDVLVRRTIESAAGASP